MATKLEKAIARIRAEDGRIVGAGILVGKRQLLTCAHVVATALGLAETPTETPVAPIHLDFPFFYPDQTQTAHVVRWTAAVDVAWLELDDDTPPDAQSVTFLEAGDYWQHPFRAFGFPENYQEGVWVHGHMRGPNDKGWIQLVSSSDEPFRIEQGFSGGLIWDDELSGVVGMVNVAARERNAAFMIPVKLPVAVWPDLAKHTMPPCPYRGLLAFREQDTPLFFGREKVSKELVKKVEKLPLIAVIGSSGSGKSSLVFAGLVPALRRARGWLAVDFRPEEQPFRNLAVALVPYLEPEMSEVERLLEARTLARALSEEELTLNEVVARAVQKQSQAVRLLLVVDQFEELYTYTHGADKATQTRFLDMLLAADNPKLSLVLTLRADFMGQALDYRPFADALQNRTLQLGPMNRAELTRAIEEPAQKLNVAFEPGLVGRILDAVGDESGNLPLLEFALTKLWDQPGQHRRLTHQAYESIGQVEGALSAHANDVYHELDKEEQAQARRLFVQLVQPGAGTYDTRRVARRSELGEINWALARQMADRRLVVMGQGAIDGQETAEVAHEALIQHWQRLRNWMDEDRTFRAWQERLRADMAQWEARNYDEGALLYHTPLAEAEGWLAERPGDLVQGEREFIQRSLALREREAVARDRGQAEVAANLRRRLVYVGVALAMAVIAVILAIVAGVRASQQQAIAENRAAEIQSAFLAGAARQALDNRNPDLAVALALLANEVVDAASSQTQAVLADAIYSADTIHTFSGHSNWVLSTAFSPDGRTVLSGSADGSLILWNIEERRKLYSFTRHTDWVWGVDINAAGTKAVSGSSDSKLILWDISDGQKIDEIEVDSGVLDVAFHPVEDQVLAGLENGNILLWDVAGEMSPLRFTGHNANVTSVTFSPDGHQALSASEDKTLLLWDVNSGSITHTHTFTEHNDLVLSAAFSPVDNGRTILSGAANGSLILWDTQSGEIIRYFQHPLDIWIYDIAFSPDGKTALTSGSDNSLRLWDVESGALIRRFDGHTGEVQSVAFSPDGQMAISGARDNTLRLWSIERGQESQASKDDFSHEVWSVAFAPDGEAIWAGLADGSLVQLDVEKLEQINSFKDHFAQVSSLFLARNSVLTGSHDQTLSLRDLTQDITLSLRNGHVAAVRSVVFNAEDHIALSGGGDHDYRITLWNTETGQAVGRLSGHTNWVTSLAFDPTGQQALSGSHDHTMILWDIESRQQIQQFRGHNGWLLSVDISPDGETALSGSEDGSLIQWDTESGRPIRQLYGHNDWVLEVAFSPDGRMALSSSKDGTLILWNAESGNELRRFIGHRDWVWGAAFSPDGRTILSGSADGSIRLWPIQPLILDELVPWLIANRYVRELTCNEREQFRVTPCN